MRRTIRGGWPLLLLLLPACQQKMANQPSVRPFERSAFHRDGLGARPVLPHTVARGQMRTDRELFTGMSGDATPQARTAAALVGHGHGLALGNAILAAAISGDYVDAFPFPITEKVLQHGKNRYMIYCIVCHDPIGTGHGKIVERGYTAPPSYHIERLRQAPVGHFYDVMTRGYGSMPSYRAQISPRDRWAIAAYLRALQLSQHFPEEKLTPDMRRELDRAEEGKR
jgi:mono/diheme cytochrome c family protein